MSTREDILQWMQSPLTEEIMGMIRTMKEEAIEDLASGNTFNSESMENTFGTTAKAIGYIEGLNAVLNIDEINEN